MRADTQDTLENYLRKYYQGEMRSGAFKLLQFVAQRALTQSRYRDGFSSLTSSFNDAGSPSTDSVTRELCHKIDRIAKWLESEHQRKAVWLSRLDEQGCPTRLVSCSIDHLYQAAQKFEVRFKKHSQKETRGMLITNEEMLKLWPLSSLPEQDMFYQQMTEGLPKGTSLAVELNKNGGVSHIEYRYQKNKKESFYFNWIINGNGVCCAEAEVSEKLRGEGIAKIVNGRLFNLFQELGVKEIQLVAGEIGAYAWARLGFVPNAKGYRDHLRSEIETRLDFIEAYPPSEGALDAEHSKILHQVLRGDNPKNLWFIVDQETPCYGTTLGKVLTMPLDELPPHFPFALARHSQGLQDLCWVGSLDMCDPDCIERYTAYLQVGLKPAPAAKMLSAQTRKTVP